VKLRLASLLLAASLCSALAQSGPGSSGLTGPSPNALVQGPPTTPPAVTSISGQIQNSTAAYGGSGPTGLSAYGSGTVTIYWTTDQPSDSTVNYGTTTSYGSSVHSGTLVTAHNVVLTGLASGTDYHYSVTSSATTGTSLPTPDAMFTSYGTTLKSLIYSGGHIGLANQSPFATSNYISDNMPADAVYLAELNSTTPSNSCKWEFSANSTGTVNNFAGCTNDTVTRFGAIPLRFHNVMWYTDNPTAMVINSSTWQGLIAFRVSGAGGIGPTYSNGATFWSFDACNECWTPGGGSWQSAGGTTFWEQPFTDLAALPASNYATTRLGVNQFEMGETSSEWGGDPAPFYCGAPAGVCKFATQSNNKVTFDRAIEGMQNFIVGGGRVDSAGYEMHLIPNYIISINDLKYQLWDLRRLGIVPEWTEANIAANGGTNVGLYGLSLGSQMNQYATNYMMTLAKAFIQYGGVKDFTFWTNTPNNAVPPYLTLWQGNQKTILYTTFEALLQDGAITPPSSFPVVRRLGFHDSLPFAGTTANTPINCVSNPPTTTPSCGTQGLITIPWTEYVYRVNNGDGTYGAVTGFSQTAWTIDLQFYTLGGATGNFFEAVDGSSNPLVTVNRASNGAMTVTIGGGSPISVGTASTNNYHGLAITKNGTNWLFSLDGGAVTTTTGSIANVANLEWLDNSGTQSPTTDAALATIDVYESASAITVNATLQATSTFQNSHVLSYDQINAFTP
jgi:GH35 family endo-1,4-beta-xylanase